jgi:hypothetical protein
MTTTRKPKRRRKVLRPAARPMRASLAPGEFAEPAAAADSDTQGLKEALAMIEIARQKLLEAQARLEAVLRDSIDDAERAEARSGLIVIQRELELLEQRRALLVGGAATLKPPSSADIAAAQSRAAELAQVLAANARVAAVMGLVTDLIRLTEELVA